MLATEDLEYSGDDFRAQVGNISAVPGGREPQAAGADG